MEKFGSRSASSQLVGEVAGIVELMSDKLISKVFGGGRDRNQS